LTGEAAEKMFSYSVQGHAQAALEKSTGAGNGQDSARPGDIGSTGNRTAGSPAPKIVAHRTVGSFYSGGDFTDTEV
jgi:hypothetical protein